MNNERPVAAAFAVSILGSVVFAVAYVAHAGTALLGLGVVLAAGGMCAAFGVWAFTLIPQEQVVDEREDFPADVADRAELGREIAHDEKMLSRPLLVRLFLAAVGAMGLASLFPFRSLGPAPHDTLFKTRWRNGLRVVREDGQPVRAEDLNVDAIVTVFPEGFVGDPASQAALVRVRPGELAGARDRNGWTPDGYIAYSKVCTHAGCPVALYRAKQRQLLCPCHQSLFDVLDDGRVLSGPADRPLPQLPLMLGSDGFLRAQGDFSDSVGPGFWEHA
ncbi:MAG: ubiquinol-cytochrome c reductase iron-sulfur subunit [Candidatus Eremiobacteraeota bacterium]|nr:ubiquinol-cytochrome c reductase iron-sulfur subunit [Candidatus Eremiobacteraeota bacterium]